MASSFGKNNQGQHDQYIRELKHVRYTALCM